MSLIQLVPRLPSPPEGVGGHAQALAAALRERGGVESRFLVGDPAWPAGEAAREARTIPARSAVTLERVLEEMRAETVLLHYANYGYQRRGCPAWLVAGLARWRARGDGRRLVTIFHEVHASGPPWRSSFWLRPLQRRLAAALAAASDALATSLDLYARALLSWAPGKRIVVLPVFSNVGEPAAVSPLATRRRRLIVFGGAGVRARAYGRALPELAVACERLGIEEVLDVGPGAETPAPATIGGVPVRSVGPLPGSAVGTLLGESLAGFLAYPPPFLAKSTIFAAYCAHGMLPVCSWTGASRPGAPLDARLYWRPRSNGFPPDAQAIASAGRSWYLEHALARQAETYRELLA